MFLLVCALLSEWWNVRDNIQAREYTHKILPLNRQFCEAVNAPMNSFAKAFRIRKVAKIWL